MINVVILVKKLSNTCDTNEGLFSEIIKFGSAKRAKGCLRVDIVTVALILNMRKTSSHLLKASMSTR